MGAKMNIYPIPTTTLIYSHQKGINIKYVTLKAWRLQMWNRAAEIHPAMIYHFMERSLTLHRIAYKGASLFRFSQIFLTDYIAHMGWL